MDRRQVLIGLSGAAFAHPLEAFAQAKPDFYTIPVELLAGLDALQGRVTLGNPRGDVTLVEFFDYNCGFCKQAAQDIRPLLQADSNLKIVLVNYAVLGVPSIGATRVALAFSRQKAGSYLTFHERMFQARGVRGPELAIDLAVKLGAKRDQLIEDADSDPVTDAMRKASKLGDSFGFQATPSYLVGKDGFSGFLSLGAKKAALAAFRQCERAVCA